MANATQTISNEIAKILSGNDIYNSYLPVWKYLLESYIGGDDYRKAGHLQRYQTESPQEYDERLRTTPLANHCQSVVSVYTSFLFREGAYRDLKAISDDPQIRDFMRDCDYEGRSLDHFMQDLSVWVSVFGHAYMIVAKPDVGAETRADEISQGVRPYLSMLTPLYVLDWEYSRDAAGRYSLDYFKYIEEVNGNVTTVKEWTVDTIKTTVVDSGRNNINSVTVEPNGMGSIPVVICYNKRSSVRGIGISDLSDIADLQKFIYNAYSEVFQSIVLNTHPSLVKTPDTNAGIGAGSIIHMEDNLDPGLKPYLLEFSGASVDSIHASILKAESDIDKIANTGAVRATESRQMSGYAIETEFQLLNSRLSQKAHSIELAEEGMWRLWSKYMGYTWDGNIAYPMSFNIRDHYNDLDFYLKALTGGVPSDSYKREVYKNIADIVVGESDNFDQIKEEIDRAAMGNFDMESMMPSGAPPEEEDLVEPFEPHIMMDPLSGEMEIAKTQQQHLQFSDRGWVHI